MTLQPLRPEVQEILDAFAKADQLIVVDCAPKETHVFHMGRKVQIRERSDLPITPRGLEKALHVNMVDRKIRMLMRDPEAMEQVQRAMSQHNTGFEVCIEEDEQAFRLSMSQAFERARATALDSAQNGQESAVVTKDSIFQISLLPTLATVSQENSLTDLFSFLQKGLYPFVRSLFTQLKHDITMAMLRRFSQTRDKISQEKRDQNLRDTVLKEEIRREQLQEEASKQNGRCQVTVVGPNGEVTTQSFSSPRGIGVQKLTRFDAASLGENL